MRRLIEGGWLAIVFALALCAGCDSSDDGGGGGGAGGSAADASTGGSTGGMGGSMGGAGGSMGGAGGSMGGAGGSTAGAITECGAFHCDIQAGPDHSCLQADEQNAAQRACPAGVGTVGPGPCPGMPTAGCESSTGMADCSVAVYYTEEDASEAQQVCVLDSQTFLTP